jgi:hypothetical protein
MKRAGGGDTFGPSSFCLHPDAALADCGRGIAARHSVHADGRALPPQQETTMARENRIERFTTHFQNTFKDEPYYDARYGWDDYDPAYKYAYKSYEENPSARFEDLETRLEAGWDVAKGKSKLAWLDAKEAVRSAWHRIESAMPGDADRDGR